MERRRTNHKQERVSRNHDSPYAPLILTLWFRGQDKASLATPEAPLAAL
jgi:hypothetical protein